MLLEFRREFFNFLTFALLEFRTVFLGFQYLFVVLVPPVV